MSNSEKNCCICESNISLFQVQEKWICENCLHIGNEKRASLWQDSIERLMKEYNEACYKCLSSNKQEDINKARGLGGEIRTVLQFIGLPKKHVLLLPIRRVQLILKKMEEADMLLAEIEELNKENKVNVNMFKLLSEKQKKANEQLTEELPILMNDSYFTKVNTFIKEELISYILLLNKEKALHKYEERFNELVDAYHQSSEVKGKISTQSFKLLNIIRKKARSLGYIYHYLNEVFGGQYLDKETYYQDIQRQIKKVDDTKDRMEQLKECMHMVEAPKKERAAVKNKLKDKMERLIENVQIHPVTIKES